ncbi:hypothetical protein C8F04DRAFT_944273 [Mycena alexandri]|uniref:Nuclear pore complex protein n=1 Tax=Mycena alexandri TaxID=1745969 RepID=A0AAD6XB21_9AGAR|nr:hypothetical protein C8F04DRAFT_944273 [Mycena alexandri]
MNAHNTTTRRGSARRPAATHLRRPLARSNSSLLGTIKNIVTAPLAWFATTEDFEDSPDPKGKRRRHTASHSAPAADDSEGPPRNKRARVKSPDSQIQFHPEPQYVAPPYSQPSLGYLDPPSSVFNNQSNFYRSNSVNITAPILNQFNPSNRSGLSRTMSIDPPHNPISFARDTTMNFTPLERDTSMEASFIRTSSSIPRDLSMPLPTTRTSIRPRSSLTPQPVQPREVSEPPPLSSLAQKPIFVRAPPESHRRLSSQSSSSSTLGSLVESQRSTRSPMRQHSSLLFGSGSQSQAAEPSSARQPAAAERALHELDIYKTPLLPTRSRLRSSPDASLPSNSSKAPDASDMFRPRRSSQLLLMRDDRRASGSGRREKEKKPKVNETKPYAGEGGMKKLLARRMKEVEEDEDGESQAQIKALGDRPDESRPEMSQPPPLPLPLPPLASTSDWQRPESQSGSSGSSLRVGRTKTSRSHITRPGRPTKKFSAAFEDDIEEFMDDGEDTEREKDLQELKEAASKIPTFDIPLGFSFAKEPDAKPVEHDANAKEPPIAALPFSFGKPSVPSETVVPLSAPKDTPAAIPEPKPSSFSAFSFGSEATPSAVTEKATEPSSNGTAVPNFFASSKLLSQASTPSPLLPSTFPSFSLSSSTPPAPSPSTDSVATPKPAASIISPSTPAPLPAASFTPTSTPIKDTENPLWVGDTAKKIDASSTGGFMFGGGTSGAAVTPLAPSTVDAEPKAPMTFGLTPTTAATPAATEAPKASPFTFGAAPSASAADTGKPSMFGASVPTPNPFASAAVPDAHKPAFGGFSFGQQKEPPKLTPPPTASPFTFGAAASAPMATAAAKPPPFSFGSSSVAPVSASAGGFSFGAGLPSSEPQPATSGGGMFTFGTPAVMAPSARPSTPPRNDMQEFRMEESPTREMQVNTELKPAETRPTLGGAGSGFSFGNPSSSGSLFGQPPAAPAPAPFSFGTSSTPNPFGAATPVESKPFGSSDFRGSASTSNPFSFGQNNAATPSIDPPRPSTAGSFSFQSSAPSTSTGFSFGGGNTTNANAFAPQPSVGSAPNSPSTFNQPFSFGGNAPQQSTSFSFGSQPVSPAGGVSTLPQPTTPGGFGGGFGGQPTSPFSAGGIAPPAQPAGGSLFTIGAAPPAAPVGNAPRVLKKLPRRKN